MDYDILEIINETVKRAIAARPVPAHVSQKQAAEMLDCSEQTVRTYLRDGRLVANSTGKIPTVQIYDIVAVRSTKPLRDV